MKYQDNSDILELGLSRILDPIISNSKLNMKEWWKSKTIILAVVQGISGVMIAFLATNPNLASIGVFAVVKSLVDIVLRMLTTKEVV